MVARVRRQAARVIALAASFVVAVGIECPAFAQPAQADTLRGRMYVGGTVFGNIEDRGHLGLREDGGTRTAGGGGSFGFFLTPRVSVGFEFTVPAFFVHEGEGYVYLDRLAGCPINQFCTTNVLGRYRESHRDLTSTAFVAFHWRPRARIRPGVLVGPTFFHTQERDFQVPFRVVPGYEPRTNRSWSATAIGATIGLDLLIRVSHNVAIVPQVRGHVRRAYFFRESYGFTQPGVAVQWIF